MPPAPNASLLARLKPLREKLIDVSLRSRLLNFRDVGSQTLPLLPCDVSLLYRMMVSDEKPLDIEGSSKVKTEGEGDAATAQAKPVKVAIDFSGENSTDDLEDGILRSRDSVIKTESRMTSMYRKYRECLDAFGSNLCYMAIGFLEWTDPNRGDDDSRFAPLILVPVSLCRTKREMPVFSDPDVFELGDDEPTVRRGRRPAARPRTLERMTAYRFTTSYDGEDVTDNVALRLKLQTLPGGAVLPDFDTEAEDVDVEAYFKRVERMIKQLPSEVSDGWRVVRAARLAFFSSAKEAMYRDLDPTMWPNTGLVDKEWIKAALDGRDADTVPSISYDEITSALHVDLVPTVLETDSSQMHAILRVLRGQPLVIQGPPGTGKSQTITNLIAATLEQGKSVLFVAEKMAALSVVRERMEETGLGRYCLELHSAKATPKQVLKQVEKRLAHQPQRSAVAGQLASDSQRMNMHRVALGNYGKSITTKGGGMEMSFTEVVWRQSQSRDELERLLSEDECDTATLPPLALAIDAGYGELSALIESLKVASRCVAEGVHLAALPWKDTCPRNYPTPQAEHGVGNILGATLNAVLAWQNAEAAMPVADQWRQPTAAEWLALRKEFQSGEAPELPAEICSHVAGDFSRLERYRRYLAAMVAWRSSVADAARALSEKATISDESIRQASWAAESVVHALISRLELGTLGALHQASEQVDWLRDSLYAREAALDEIAKLVHLDRRGDIFADGSALAVDAARLAALPPGVWRAIHSALLRPASAQQLLSAKQHHLALSSERDALQRQVRLADLPSDENWAALAQELRLTASGWFNWLPGTHGYKLRRQLRSFFIQRPRDDEASIQLVDKALHCRHNVAAFEINADAQMLLGPAFRGILTDWEALTTAASICGEWSQRFGLNAAQALVQNKDAVFDNSPRLAELAIHADANCVDMLSLAVVLFRQDDSTLRHLAVSSLIRDVVAQAVIAKAIVADIDVIELPRETLTDAVPSLCMAAQNLRRQKEEVAQLVSDPMFLGPLHQGMLATDTKVIEGAISWIARVIETPGLPAEVKRWTLSDSPALRATTITEGLQNMADKIGAWQTSLQQLDEALIIESANAALSPTNLERSSATIREHIEAALGATASLAPWYQLRESEREIAVTGGASLWNWCREWQLPSAAVEQAAHLAFWSQTLQDTTKRHPELASYHRQKLEEYRFNFRELDKRVLGSFKSKVDGRIFRNPADAPTGQRRGSTKDYTEMAMLRHEMSKQTRHVPVRRLVRQSGAALKHLMPCWMMGPMAVAQFLEPEHIEFDLLIIDEASQVRPEDALGSLARAKQIVIVGDSKQMPPTDVFQALGVQHGDEDTEDEDGEFVSSNSPALDLTSILDLFEKQLPAETLRWHYRSQHQSLIAFSNECFYKSELIVPPSRWHDSDELGIKRHFVDGRLQDRRNPAEAAEVVKLMRDHVLREAVKPEQNRETLGVVAMNATQQDLIAEQWEKALKEDTILDESLAVFACAVSLFIRNLENVQGDERDVIIISTTYGKNAAGAMHQRFGPLNKAGGWRRLNVLITRARKRIHLVTSMVHSDVQVDTSQAESGRNYLRKYLQYVETGHLPDTGIGSAKSSPDSPFEVSVAGCLAGMGYEFHYQVGVQGFFIDIGVLHPDHPGQYICGIECDGAAYHSHPIARDRDRIRQEILEQRGWDIFRIWSTDWHRNRQTEIERLRAHLAKRLRAAS